MLGNPGIQVLGRHAGNLPGTLEQIELKNLHRGQEHRPYFSTATTILLILILIILGDSQLPVYVHSQRHSADMIIRSCFP